MRHVLRVLHSLQRKVHAESAFGYHHESLILARTHQKQLLFRAGYHVQPFEKKFFIKPRIGSYTIPFVQTATE
jgi:hypothetical protein